MQPSCRRLSPEHVIHDLKDYFISSFTSFFIASAAQRIAITAYAQGVICPFLSAVGKVPGDAEYATLYVYAMESICP